MNPLAVKLTNLRTFRELDLTLPDGCVAVTGEIRGAPEGIGSNGAGKSTIPLAVELALFGPPPGFRALQEFMTAGGLADRVEVELTFEHAGTRLRVRRGWKAGKPTLDFEEWMDGPEEGEPGWWHPLTQETTKATQAFIERTIGLTQDTYRASSYLAQGDTGSFTEALPSKRKGIIAEAVLGRDPVWPRLLGRVREDKQAAEKELAGVEARLEAADEELAERDELLNAYEFAHAEWVRMDERLGLLEDHLGDLQEDQQALERRTAERRAAEAEHQAAEQARQRLREQADAAETARRAIVEAQERLRDLPDGIDVKMAEDDYHRRVEAFQRREQERRVLLERLAGLDDPLCPTCQRPFENADEIARVASTIHRSLDLLPALPEPSRVKADAFRQKQEERARLEERIQAWQETVADAPREFDYNEADELARNTREHLESLPPVDPAEIRELQHQTLQARRQVAEQRERLDEARTEKARLEERLERLNQIEADRAGTLIPKQQMLRKKLDVLAVLDKAYGRDGIPALIVENVAIPVIETEANRILMELGTGFRVELRTQREKVDGNLTDALDVVVVDEQGNERDYATYSGGERTRLAISLRIALAVYMATHGAESRVLIIDEPEGLDEAGMAALAGVMRRLGSVFTRQLLVSHVPALRDAFDSVIHIVKEDGVSRVETANVPMGVAS